VPVRLCGGWCFIVTLFPLSYRKSQILKRTWPPRLKKWSCLNQNKFGDFSYPTSITQTDQVSVFPLVDKSVQHWKNHENCFESFWKRRDDERLVGKCWR
jgi:hypothetical protein